MFIDAQVNRYLFSVVCVVSGVASKSLLSALSASDSPKLLVLLESPAFGFTELAAVFWIGSGGGRGKGGGAKSVELLVVEGS